jgi:hypothetical protein
MKCSGRLCTLAGGRGERVLLLRGGSAGLAYCAWRLCSDWRAVIWACCHDLGRSPLEQYTMAFCSALLLGSHKTAGDCDV